MFEGLIGFWQYAYLMMGLTFISVIITLLCSSISGKPLWTLRIVLGLLSAVIPCVLYGLTFEDATVWYFVRKMYKMVGAAILAFLTILLFESISKDVNEAVDKDEEKESEL